MIMHTLWFVLLLYFTGRETVDTQNVTSPGEGAVRLTGSWTPSEGRVEIFHAGQWGTVCNRGWDMSAAQVVCRQLGYTRARQIVQGRQYRQDFRPIWLDEVRCRGYEGSLTQCEHRCWGSHDCSHYQYAGVACDRQTGFLFPMTTGAGEPTASPNVTVDHFQQLAQDLGQLFDSGEGCDLQIQVESPPGCLTGSDNTVTQSICAHKLILRPFPYFSVSKGIGSISVQIDNSCQPYFPSFIRYLYTRQVDLTSSSLHCLHWMASKFSVKELMEDIGRVYLKFLSEPVSFHTLTSLYDYAVEAGDSVLQESVTQFLAWNYDDLTRSPAWGNFSLQLLHALLSRSDLVVPDEAFVLSSLDLWIRQGGNWTTVEEEAELLKLIRFPMMSAQALYELQFSCSMYDTHRELFRENVVKSLQFNVIPLSILRRRQNFSTAEKDYQPRIYTAKPWSIAIASQRTYNYYDRYAYQQYYYYDRNTNQTFDTPVHNTVMFKDKKISWNANLLSEKHQCSDIGIQCTSLPACVLTGSARMNDGDIVFRNVLLVMCQGKSICQVHHFNSTVAYPSSAGSEAPSYPCRCPSNDYQYQFVVRPAYV